MAKKVLLGVAVIAVVAVGYMIYRGSPRTEPGADATIQKAERYRTNQIQSEDVALKDPEIQNLLQSDFFDRLIHDKGFQKMAADGSLAKMDVAQLVVLSRALDTVEFRQALERHDVSAAKATLDRVDLAGRSTYDKALIAAALDKVEFREALAKNDLARAMESLERVELSRADLGRAVVDAILGVEPGAGERLERVSGATACEAAGLVLLLPPAFLAAARLDVLDIAAGDVRGGALDAGIKQHQMGTELLQPIRRKRHGRYRDVPALGKNNVVETAERR